MTANALKNTLGLLPEQACPDVVLSPGWPPERLFPEESLQMLVAASPLHGYRIWRVSYEGVSFLYVICGFGAPMVLDAALLLSKAGCKRLLFVSSVGTLAPEFAIGDLVLPYECLDGTGASRYLGKTLNDYTFAQPQRPNAAAYAALTGAASQIAPGAGVRLHAGRLFCMDSIAGQARYLDEIRSLKCNCLDMESAALFTACAQNGVAAAAILQVSDNPAYGRSLLEGRALSNEERRYRSAARGTLAQIVLRTLKATWT